MSVPSSPISSVLSFTLRALYTLVLLVSQPVLALYLIKRALKQREYLAGWTERFLATGPTFTPATNGQRRIWVHAVSVGEAHAISPLIQQWSKVYPEHEWVVSCTTPTGRATCESLYGQLRGVRVFYMPYDLPWLIARTVRRLNADVLWIVETELWPNLLAVSKSKGLSTFLLNARISPSTGKRLKQLSLISRPALQSLTGIVCQTQADADVFESLGRPADAVCGNMKFDVALKPELAQLGKQWRSAVQADTVLLFASSREGEEALLMEALVRSQFFKRMPNACVWVVPRHPQRFDEVYAVLSAASVKLGVAQPVRRSKFPAVDQSDGATTAFKVLPRLLLGDSMGEMPAYYSAADLALLGGSWEPLGGQNLIEACAYGCPVWMGPHTFNFSKAADDALKGGAARRFDTVHAAISAFLSDFARNDEFKKKAFAYARSHRGATQTTLATLTRLLPTNY